MEYSVLLEPSFSLSAAQHAIAPKASSNAILSSELHILACFSNEILSEYVSFPDIDSDRRTVGVVLYVIDHTYNFIFFLPCFSSILSSLLILQINFFTMIFLSSHGIDLI